MKNLLIITYWNFSDALIQAYTLPYVRILKKHLPQGSRVFLLTLEKEPVTEKVRRDIESLLHEQGINWYPIRYQPFGLSAFWMWLKASFGLMWLISRNSITHLHCWCTPAGAIGYLLSIVTRRSLIIDSYEPHAEAMVENKTWSRKGMAFRILFWLEKKQTHRASSIVSATTGMRQYAKQKYGCDIRNFYVKPACVDLDKFDLKFRKTQLRTQLGFTDEIVCVYAGKFGGIYLDQEVFDFFAVASEYWKGRFRILLLSNHSRSDVDALCEKAGLDKELVTLKFVKHSEIPAYLGTADFALTPVKPVPSKRYCTPIKDGEYWALGLPVIIPANISDDSNIIKKYDIGAVLESFDRAAYVAAIAKIETLLKDPDHIKRIRAVAERYRNFQIAEVVYSKVYSKN